MITSIFSKSRPFNSVIVVIALFFCFAIYQFKDIKADLSVVTVVQNLLVLGLLIFSMFVTNFIAKRNDLNKNNSYTLLFHLIAFLFFPVIFKDLKIVMASFFVILAMRRMISMQSMQSLKEKIFDASLWIFVATLFHFWAIIFILLVFISIISHAPRDYRNWIIPFIAFFGGTVITIFFGLLFSQEPFFNYLYKIEADFTFDYFKSNIQNLSFILYSLYSLLFLAALLFSLTKRPLILLSSYYKIISSFTIGVLIYLVSPDKNNSLLIFTIAPMVIMATSYIEIIRDKVLKEIILISFLVIGLLMFFFQL
jgi:hypothetical protein